MLSLLSVPFSWRVLNCSSRVVAVTLFWLLFLWSSPCVLVYLLDPDFLLLLMCSMLCLRRSFSSNIQKLPTSRSPEHDEHEMDANEMIWHQQDRRPLLSPNYFAEDEETSEEAALRKSELDGDQPRLDCGGSHVRAAYCWQPAYSCWHNCFMNCGFLLYIVLPAVCVCCCTVLFAYADLWAVVVDGELLNICRARHRQLTHRQFEQTHLDHSCLGRLQRPDYTHHKVRHRQGHHHTPHQLTRRTGYHHHVLCRLNLDR